VTWSSSDTSKATVSASGLVTAIAVGSATITVTTEDGAKTATCVVTVTNGGTTGLLTVTATYNGSQGTVSSTNKIYVQYSSDHFNNGPSGLIGEIQVNGGSVTRGLAPGTYQIVAIFDHDGNGSSVDPDGDAGEFYENITDLEHLSSCTNIVVTAGSSQSISIEFDDTLTFPVNSGGGNSGITFAFDTKTIVIDGNFSDWDSITQKVDDPSGDTLGGYAGDDIEYVKVAKDANNIYFLVKMYEDFSTAYDGSCDIRINGFENSSLSYTQFYITTNYSNSSWVGTIWGNPGNVNLSQSASYVAVGTSYMEIKIPLNVIGNPTKFTNIGAAVMNYTHGSDVESVSSFGEL